MTARRIDKALEQFRAGERDLYTEDGQKLYSDEEHERRHEALLERFYREKDSAVAEADRAIEKAERTLALACVLSTVGFAMGFMSVAKPAFSSSSWAQAFFLMAG